MTYDDFLTQVLPSVQGCAEPVALEHVIRACRAFCARTHCWTYETEPVLTVVGQPIYPLDLDQDHERVKLVDAWIDGVQVGVHAPSLGRSLARAARSGAFVYMENALDLVVYPTPDTAGLSIVTQIAVKPSMSSTEWPDELAEHVTDISYGALASLQAIPRQEWTDLNAAQMNQGMFERRIGVVGLNVTRGYGRGAARPPIRFF